MTSKLNHLYDNKIYFKLVQSYTSKYENIQKNENDFVHEKLQTVL